MPSISACRLDACGRWLRVLGLLVTLLLSAELTECFSQVCANPPSGITSWWGGDGTAQDELGANPAVLQNGTTFTTGKVGQSFSFDGVDDYVYVPASSSLDVGSGGGFTIEGGSTRLT